MMSLHPPASNKLEVQETTAWAERRLRDGTNLKYRLTILQQPERARACGQGAKSHADRRPVDPPPVVELRLFKGDDQNDVTFSYNSNFFLFATLEQARPIANGRVVPAPAQAPVLTGVPVSGMAYLDRPAPAGYFIFPDLSVRHEGKYRLHFALFEECKEDEDRQQQEITHFRLEVKSKPFTVFSAKKFPGLSESTALSRIVAEQGCRVRIRRDVRMRRRPEKAGREDTPEDERREVKREEKYERPYQGHLSFGGQGQQPAAAPPPAQAPAPPPVQAAPAPAPAPVPAPVQQAPTPTSAPTPPSWERRDSGEFYKRSSGDYRYPTNPTPPAPAPYYRNSRDDLPPLKLAPLEPRMSAGSLNSPSANTLPSPRNYNYQQQQRDWSYPEKLVAAPEPAPRHAGSKRSWDRVFNDSHVRDRLTNGMRPNSNNYGIDADDDDEDEFDYASLRMSYRRADGVQIVRSLPDETE